MIRQLIPKPIRRLLSRLLFPKSPVLWANWGFISLCLAKWIRPQSPPVVILSMPRSGSSWVGETLGMSAESLYLREPITQTYLKSVKKGSPSFFEINPNQLPEKYELSIKHAFAGLPSFNQWITKIPHQWKLSKRKHKHIVIKEVNPFMLEWLIREFQPKIIFLIRHPAAVASSFKRMGWSGDQFEFRLSNETLKTKVPQYKQFTDSFWSAHGAFQGFVLNEILTQATAYNDLRVIQYEDLCADPINTFKELYQFAELPWDDTIEKHIQERSQPKQIDNHSFSTQRNSAYEMVKWKQELTERAIQQIKDAYLSFDPVYYRDEW